jgi:glycosyltransferase involved in cell wall biosynthesis
MRQPMPAKPVILQIIPALGTGGAERTVIDVAEAIVAGGGVALVASEGGRREAELVAIGGEPIRFPAAAKSPLTMLANARRLQRLIVERGVSLIHARSRAPAWSALLAARRAGVPLVTTYHGIYNQKSRLKGWYNSVMARGDLVIANSHYTASIVKARHGVAEARLRVIPRGVDLQRFSPGAVTAERRAALRRQWGVSGDGRLVVLAARLTRWKGQHTVIGAASLVLAKPEFADVTFILAGDDQGRAGYRDELAARIAALGLGGRVLMPGHCADMPAGFALAALALVPSIEPEAFGRTSIEAQAMGCPVIVSDLGALPETIALPPGAGPVGPFAQWTFPAGDEEALAARVETALGLSGEPLAAMAEAGRRRVAALFSKSALQLKTLKIYDNLLDSTLAPAFETHSSQNEDSVSSLDRISV